MQPLDVVWHLLNFFGPAVGVGFLAPLLAKLLWRTELAATSWRSLLVWTTAAGSASLLGGLVVFGHDGRMVTYAVMVLAAATSLWWIAFASPAARRPR